MKTLEIKHLKHYLDHDLLCHSMGEFTEETLYDDTPEPLTFKLHGLVNNKASIIGIAGKQVIELQDLFPLLIPLSHIYKGIAKDVMKKLDCSLTIVHDIWELSDNITKLNKVTFETYKVMCKNHIDFQGLIPAGLGIDKTTLK